MIAELLLLLALQVSWLEFSYCVPAVPNTECQPGDLFYPTATDKLSLRDDTLPNSPEIDWIYASSCTKTPGAPRLSGTCDFPTGTLPRKYSVVYVFPDGQVLATLLQSGQPVLVPGTAMTYTNGSVIWARNAFCAEAGLIPRPMPELQCQGTLVRNVSEKYNDNGVLIRVDINYATSINKAVDCVVDYDFVPRQVFSDNACAPYKVPCFDPDRDKHFSHHGNLNQGGIFADVPQPPDPFACPNPGSALSQPLLPDGGYCQEWYGLGLDIGACEFVAFVQDAAPNAPLDLTVAIRPQPKTDLYIEWFRPNTTYEVVANGQTFILSPEPDAGEDLVGRFTVGPDGAPDVHLIVPTTGFSSVIVRGVDQGGIWETPFNGSNWIVLIK